MIKIDPNKTKSLVMEATIEGIQSDEMKFMFRIQLDENIEVGFPCKFSGTSIDVNIPKLSTYIKGIKNGSYDAILEATSKTHYLKPFADKILIESEPKIQLKSIDEVVKPTEVKIASITEVVSPKEEITLQEEVIIEKPVEVIPKKKSKITSFLTK